MGISNIVEGVLGRNTSKTVSLSVEGKIKEGSYSIEGELFDCIVETKTTLKNKISENPVEFGVNVTDNIVPQQRVYELSGVLTAYFGFKSFITFGLPNLSSQNNTQIWYDRLVEISKLELGGLITLSIYPKSFPNLVVESLQFDDSYSVGEGLNFKMTLKEVQIAEQTLPEGAVKRTASPANANSSDKGSTTTNTADASSVGAN